MLEELGLSSYENKVYLSLLDTGTTDARSISKQSEVPFGRIYDVLNMLESKGIILKQSGRPQKFSPVKPKLVLEKLIEEKRLEIEQITDKAKKVEEELSLKFEQLKNEQALFWRVAVKDEIHPTFVELINEAEIEVCEYLDITEQRINHPQTVELFHQIPKLFENLNKKGVKIKLLLGIDDLEIMNKFASNLLGLVENIGKFCEMRMCKKLSEPFGVVDEEKVILKIKNPADLDAQELAMMFLWEKKLAEELHSKFLEIWDRSEDFEFRTELITKNGKD
ncbi:MAG: TrmB family transcriptional regulator [Candidatus Heimdallarchaeota archaeon]|nr:TrmB family transcriptional regulator [Candidatus Heimdallarchaeota archaeon]